jgi:tetratricopeptide (TPR) repeat protein
MIALSKLGNEHEALALLEKALTLDPANQYILDAKSRLQS